MPKCSSILAILFISLLESGCFGETIPDVHEPFQTIADEQTKENVILAQVKCELQQGLLRINTDFYRTGKGYGYASDWITSWAAKVDLKITVEEKSLIGPGASYLSGPLTLSVGAQSDSTATRIEDIGVTWTVKEILAEKYPHPCSHVRKIQIESDLKIDDFLVNKAFLARVPGNIEHSKLRNPFDVFSYEASFIVTYGGSINPSWKFTRFTVNDNSTLLNTSRSRTDDLVITLGPSKKDESGVAQLTPEANDVRLASLIGQAVASQLRRPQP